MGQIRLRGFGGRGSCRCWASHFPGPGPGPDTIDDGEWSPEHCSRMGHGRKQTRSAQTHAKSPPRMHGAPRTPLVCKASTIWSPVFPRPPLASPRHGEPPLASTECYCRQSQHTGAPIAAGPQAQKWRAIRARPLSSSFDTSKKPPKRVRPARWKTDSSSASGIAHDSRSTAGTGMMPSRPTLLDPIYSLPSSPQKRAMQRGAQREPHATSGGPVSATTGWVGMHGTYA